MSLDDEFDDLLCDLATPSVRRSVSRQEDASITSHTTFINNKPVPGRFVAGSNSRDVITGPEVNSIGSFDFSSNSNDQSWWLNAKRVSSSAEGKSSNSDVSTDLRSSQNHRHGFTSKQQTNDVWSVNGESEREEDIRRQSRFTRSFSLPFISQRHHSDGITTSTSSINSTKHQSNLKPRRISMPGKRQNSWYKNYIIPVKEALEPPPWKDRQLTSNTSFVTVASESVPLVEMAWEDELPDVQLPKPVTKRSSSIQSKAPTITIIGANVENQCQVCGKIVYEMEKTTARNIVYHAACFRCHRCQRILKATDFVTVNDKQYCSLRCTDASKAQPDQTVSVDLHTDSGDINSLPRIGSIKHLFELNQDTKQVTQPTKPKKSVEQKLPSVSDDDTPLHFTVIEQTSSSLSTSSHGKHIIVHTDIHETKSTKKTTVTSHNDSSKNKRIEVNMQQQQSVATADDKKAHQANQQSKQNNDETKVVKISTTAHEEPAKPNTIKVVAPVSNEDNKTNKAIEATVVKNDARKRKISYTKTIAAMFTIQEPEVPKVDKRKPSVTALKSDTKRIDPQISANKNSTTDQKITVHKQVKTSENEDKHEDNKHSANNNSDKVGSVSENPTTTTTKQQSDTVTEMKTQNEYRNELKTKTANQNNIVKKKHDSDTDDDKSTLGAAIADDDRPDAGFTRNLLTQWRTIELAANVLVSQSVMNYPRKFAGSFSEKSKVEDKAQHQETTKIEDNVQQKQFEVKDKIENKVHQKELKVVDVKHQEKSKVEIKVERQHSLDDENAYKKKNTEAQNSIVRDRHDSVTDDDKSTLGTAIADDDRPEIGFTRNLLARWRSIELAATVHVSQSVMSSPRKSTGSYSDKFKVENKMEHQEKQKDTDKMHREKPKDAIKMHEEVPMVKDKVNNQEQPQPKLKDNVHQEKRKVENKVQRQYSSDGNDANDVFDKQKPEASADVIPADAVKSAKMLFESLQTKADKRLAHEHQRSGAKKEYQWLVHEKTYVCKSHTSSSMDRSKSVSMRSLIAFDKNDKEDDAFSFRPRSSSTGNNDNPPENITKSLVSKFQDIDDKSHNASTSHINTDEMFMPAADATRKLVARFQRGGEIRRRSSSSSSDELVLRAEVALTADNKVPVIKKKKKETFGKTEKSDAVRKEENGPRSNSNDDKNKPPEDITRSLVLKYQSFNDKTHIAATTNMNSDNNIMPAANTTRNMVARFEREEGEIKRKFSSSDDDVLAEVTRPAPAKLSNSLTSPFETDNEQKANACEKTTASVSKEQKRLVSKEEKMGAVSKDEKKDPVNLLDERIDEVQNLIALVPTSNTTAAPVAHQDLFFSDGLHEMTVQKKTGRRLGSRSNSSSSSDNECGVSGQTTTDFSQHNTNNNFHLQIIT